MDWDRRDESQTRKVIVVIRHLHSQPANGRRPQACPRHGCDPHSPHMERADNLFGGPEGRLIYNQR